MSDPLRILFLSIEYPPESPNGIGSYVVEVAAALARRGHEVHVLSCIPGQERRDYRDGEVWVHRRDDRVLRGLARVVRGRRTLARIRHAVACRSEARALGRFDVVETPDWMAEGLLVRGPLVAQLHTPLAVTADYGDVRRTRDVRVAAWLERRTVQRAAAVSSPSQLLLDEVQARGWKLRDPRVVRIPIDTTRWTPQLAVRDTPRRVVFAGRLEPLKAPDVLVEAAALLAGEFPDLEVVLAGRSGARVDGREYGEWLQERIDALGAPCRLLGQVSRDEVRELAGTARVFALPSRYENFPLAVLEALAAARPVVCSTNTGAAEILDGSGAGASFPVGDAAALAAALRPYLADAEHADAAGRKGLELVRERCSPDGVAAAREALYRAVARRR